LISDSDGDDRKVLLSQAGFRGKLGRGLRRKKRGAEDKLDFGRDRGPAGAEATDTRAQRQLANGEGTTPNVSRLCRLAVGRGTAGQWTRFILRIALASKAPAGSPKDQQLSKGAGDRLRMIFARGFIGRDVRRAVRVREY